MDPDANLREQLELAQKLHLSDQFQPLHAGYGDRLAELVLALDEWLRKGGALPKAWTPPGLYDPERDMRNG